MPYRIDIPNPPDDALDGLAQLGALDVEPVDGGLAAIIPDGVSLDTVAGALGMAGATVSPAVGRDDGSVWILSPTAVRAGGVLIVPPGVAAPPDAIRLTDSTVFGTGLHPTTTLCLEALEEVLVIGVPERLLDVGTGSGVLALAGLMKGVPEATGLDIDPDALRVAGEHARLNEVSDRLQLVLGGPGAVDGTWPLVFANVLAASLIEMAPVLVRRIGHRGRLILSGIPWSVAPDVERAYRRLGMRALRSETRAGWTALMAEAAW